MLRSREKTGLLADQSFACDDIHAVQEKANARGWDVSFTQLEKGRFSGRYEVWECPGMLLTHEVYGRKADLAGTAPSDQISLFFPSRNSGPIGFEGLFPPADGFLVIEPGQEINITTHASVEFTSLQIDRSLFDRISRSICGDDGATRFLGSGVLLPSPLLMAKVREMLPASGADGCVLVGLRDSVSARRRLGSKLTQCVVTAISNYRHQMASRQEIRLMRTSCVARRARDFLEANLNRNVSRAELCTASRAKLRTLHHSFHHVYGVSPIAYHRYRRLKQARDQLVRGLPVRLTVAQVATSWGFDHGGRFAADYRAVFGEPPATTLAQQPSD